ncbi:MAG: hypothetical protein A3I66_18795 [Burkholderiales bacterium RIFCSPLOWO2_02_FULL_57_36]|nr:MAG: hypothetical protein A3I66_18795 [Burkholderiales bacterium RIFCSPLOWO2_02_FULL_57_36]
MQKVWLALVSMSLSTAGYAQVHKCTVDGRMVYQQELCAGTGQSGRVTHVAAAPSGGESTPTASTPLLWPGVEFGMTRPEVLRLVPGSTEHRGSVKLEGFRYAAKTFNVQFGFKSDRLVQAHLGDVVFMELNAATRQAFDRLVTTVSRTYGQPVSQSVEGRASGLYGKALWRRGRSEITVDISPITQHHSTILFNFFVEGARLTP